MEKKYNNIVSLQLTDEQFNYLKAYCNAKDITYSKALRTLLAFDMLMNDKLPEDQKIKY